MELNQMDFIEDDIEDESDEDIFYYCSRMKQREPCPNHGVCVRFLYMEGRFAVCESFTITDDPDEVGANEIDENN